MSRRNAKAQEARPPLGMAIKAPLVGLALLAIVLLLVLAYAGNGYVVPTPGVSPSPSVRAT